MSIPIQKTAKILQALKDLMNQRKLRYGDVAEALRVSLPTVKRWMTDDDISISRLAQICGVLGVELEDLILLASKTQSRPHRFSEEQEIFFARNPSYLAYYFELKKGLSPSEIERKHEINRSTSKLIIKKLEQMRLVRMRSLESIQILHPTSLEWDDNGPLGLTFSKAMLREFADHAVASLGKPGSLFLALWNRALTSDQVAEMRRDFQNLEEKYRQLSDDNRRFLPEEQYQNVACAVIADHWEARAFSRVANVR